MDSGSSHEARAAGRLHSTREHYGSGVTPLGWELTLCNALHPEKSPCRRVLRKADSYGNLLYGFLSRRVPMEKVRRVIEIGGGYGFLMRDFLTRNGSLDVTMLDISPFLSQKQKEALHFFEVEYRVGDCLETDPSLLRDKDLAVLNEVLGDFPTALGIPLEALDREETCPDDLSRKVFRLFERYGLKRPQTPFLDFNVGAVEALEKLCMSGIPYIFLCEHSCEATVPAGCEGLLRISPSEGPERIRLKGHDEYTIRFSHLEAVATAFRYDMERGSMADVLEVDFREEVRCILSRPSVLRDEDEIIRHFVEDLYKYEYLLLQRIAV